MDPTSVKFNRRAIRAHPLDSLKNGYIGIFPFEEKSGAGYEEAVVIPVYCDCRLPYTRCKNAPIARSGSIKPAKKFLTKFSSIKGFNGSATRPATRPDSSQEER